MSAAAALSAIAASAASTNSVSFDAGAELRLRYDLTDNLPNSTRGEADASSYARIRVRPWFSAEREANAFYFRLSDEFRYYHRPKSSSRKQRWPDVLFIDNMYFLSEGIFGDFDLKAGRQDMSFGSERIFSDGVAGDGSRARFFDAVRLTWHPDTKRTLDGIVLFQNSEDWLPTLGKTHANGVKPHHYDLTGYAQDEFAAALYWQDRAIDGFGYDLYCVSKLELRDSRSRYRSEGKSAIVNTFGGRLLPQFTETLGAEIELSGQAGSGNLLAGQAYGGLVYTPKSACNPKFTAACWTLSGDSDGDRGKNAWHAVFNRETGLGEAIAPMYNRYSYTNLAYPHLGFSCDVGERSFVEAQAGPMYTAAREKGAGAYRGMFVFFRWEYDLGGLAWTAFTRGASFAFQGEYFGKGGYFRDGCDNPAFFGRVELVWEF